MVTMVVLLVTVAVVESQNYYQGTGEAPPLSRPPPPFTTGLGTSGAVAFTPWLGTPIEAVLCTLCILREQLSPVSSQ